MVQKGHANYNLLIATPSTPYRKALCEVADDETLAIGDCIDVLQEVPVPYHPEQFFPTTSAEVEVTKSMRFDSVAYISQRDNLFVRADGSTDTRLRGECRCIFEHSASASFFAYLPLYCWQQVLHEINANARANKLSIGEPFVLQEIMTFLCILLYMKITVKGKYAYYWRCQAEEDTFGASSLGLEHIMLLKRFKLPRQTFSFRSEVSMEDIQRDPAARIRNTPECIEGHRRKVH